ncbi:MAG: hypothetical protein AB1400_06765 [Pseudomonadota bacterium]
MKKTTLNIAISAALLTLTGLLRRRVISAAATSVRKQAGTVLRLVVLQP